MKRNAVIAALTLLSLSFTIPSSAHRLRENDGFDHPLHIVFLAVHPLAVGLEYAVERPIHWAVSQPNADILFGHKSHPSDDATYFEWTHGDFSPSIAEEQKVKAITATPGNNSEPTPGATQGAATRKHEAGERRERNATPGAAAAPKSADEREMNNKMASEAREKAAARREMRERAAAKTSAAESQKAASTPTTDNSASKAAAPAATSSSSSSSSSTSTTQSRSTATK